MTNLTYNVYFAAVRYFDGDAKRIQHFTKVLQFSSLIAEGEKLNGRDRETLSVAAILHDIGIPNCEKKYGNCMGTYQQTEGVPVARELLSHTEADAELTDAVCEMISLHHSYSKIGNNRLLRILVEADMLVNAYEEEVPKESLARFAENIVRTDTGRTLYREIYKV